MAAVSIFTFRGTEGWEERDSPSTTNAEPRYLLAQRQLPLLPGQPTAAGTGNTGSTDNTWYLENTHQFLEFKTIVSDNSNTIYITTW